MPYLYTVMEDNTRTGLPLLRPLFLEFPDATADRHPIDVDLDASGEFMVGPDLLVTPPPFPDKLDDYDAKLPSTGWFDFWTGKRVDAGQARVIASGLQPEAAIGAVSSAVHIHPQLAGLPVFVRPGAIIPIAPLVQSTSERPQGPLKLRVFPGSDCSGALYQDDGATFAYKAGDFLRMTFTCDASANKDAIAIHIGRHQGRYPAWWKDIEIEVNGLLGNPASVTVDGRPISSTPGDQSTTFTVPDGGGGIAIAVHR